MNQLERSEGWVWKHCLKYVQFLKVHIHIQEVDLVIITTVKLHDTLIVI